MRFGVLGTGTVGRTIATKLASLGHDVMMGTRNVEALMARTEPDPMGNEPFSSWSEGQREVRVGTFTEAARHGEVMWNATNGAGTLEALAAAGHTELEGKILIDVANPLDFSGGMPPSLFVSNTDSLGEQIQRTFPGAKVVKTLNTMNAFVMVDPSLVAAGEHAVFVSGNDGQAKAEVAELLRSFGWKHIIDLGDITSARGTEMYLALWLRIRGAIDTGTFNIAVAR